MASLPEIALRVEINGDVAWTSSFRVQSVPDVGEEIVLPKPGVPINARTTGTEKSLDVLRIEARRFVYCLDGAPQIAVLRCTRVES